MKKLFVCISLILSFLTQAQDINFLNALPVVKGETYIASLPQDGTPHYYKTHLSTGGTLKMKIKTQNTGSVPAYFKVEIFDNRRSSALLSKEIGNTFIPSGTSITDSLIIHCLESDSIFFKITAGGVFSYEWTFDMLQDAISEPEKNDNFQSALTFLPGAAQKGTIGYFKEGLRDNDDYYKYILNSKGHLTLTIQAFNTGNSTGKMEILIYDEFHGFWRSKIISGNTVSPGMRVTDTVMVSCVDTDTLFIRITAESCFTYILDNSFETAEPKAEFTYEKLGNTIGFRPVSDDPSTNYFYWSFGDRPPSSARTMREEIHPDEFSYSNSPFPMETFKPGVHKIKLEVTDPVCYFSKTVTIDLVVEGVEYYTPDNFGVGGDLNLSVFGGGLHAGTEISLLRENTRLRPFESYSNSIENHFTALFDVHSAQPGLYDVIIAIPGVDTLTYPQGLRLEKMIYPETTSEVLGPGIWRTTSSAQMQLAVFNKGNIMASGVVVALVWPRDMTVTFDNKFYSPPKTGTETVVVDGETFSLSRADYRFIYDSLETVTAIDSFKLKPYEGYIQYILVPHVPAHGSIEIPFTVTSNTQNPGKNRIITYTFKTNQRGSCDNPVFGNYNEDLTAELIDGMDMIVDKTNITPLKILSKTAKIGQKHAGSASSYLGKKFWAWYDGYEMDEEAAMAEWLKETEANNAFAIQTATDELGSLVFDKASAKMLDKYKDQVDFINKRLANNPNMSAELTEKYLAKLNSLPHDQMRRLETLKGLFSDVKNLSTLSDKLVKLQKLVDECPELKAQLEDLIKSIENELGIKDEKEKETELSNSFDPNMIIGPAGTGPGRYLNRTAHQPFTIFFENMDSATASAQIVIIRDTLDKNKYDLSTFEFGNMGVGKNRIRLPKGRKEFVIERHIPQNLPIKLRINGVLDTATGVIEWQFTSIDTLTGKLPFLDGFLPPNKANSEGEGYVSFVIKPFNDLTDGTVFTNRASIIFDQNDPILTNTWQNILDLGKPTSTLYASRLSDSLIKLDFSGQDQVSGMGFYNLYVKKNDGNWIKTGGTTEGSMLLLGEADSTYSFFVISEDRVGNLETKTPFAEATITLQNVLQVDFGRLEAKASGEGNQLIWNTLAEDPGDYFIIERSENGQDFTGIIKIEGKSRPSVYNYLDAQTDNNDQYYRIKIFTQAGHFYYSNIVLVRTTVTPALRVYPNPATKIITIENKDAGGELSITNTLGQKIYTQNINSKITRIDMSPYPSGLYYFMYKKNGKIQKIKVLKN